MNEISQRQQTPFPEYQDDDDINIAIYFNLTKHAFDGMEISALYMQEQKNCKQKALEKKILFELLKITPSGLLKQAILFPFSDIIKVL